MKSEFSLYFLAAFGSTPPHSDFFVTSSLVEFSGVSDSVGPVLLRSGVMGPFSQWGGSTSKQAKQKAN